MKATIEKNARTGRTTALCLAAVLAALLLVLAETAQAQNGGTKSDDQIVFASNRTAGAGVNNPTGDFEIFVMKPDGMVKQLTSNTIDDSEPTLSPDGEKIAYTSNGVQTSNPEGDFEVYLMNAADGSDGQNLSNTANFINDVSPDFAPDGEKIAYTIFGKHPSNPEGDTEVYLMEADGSKQRNVTDTAGGIVDREPDFGKAKK